MSRVVVWFSCGKASAVAAKLAVEKYGDPRIVYCNTLHSEHADNLRFLNAVSEWVGRPIEIIASTKYAHIDEVFVRERYMSGVKGAKCTVEMKKKPRFAYQQPDDIHIFGYAADEKKRIDRFINGNPELTIDHILLDAGITTAQCHEIIAAAGIDAPAMYGLGFDHNNCIGCVKSESPGYWNKIRKHFPDVFKRRCEQSRALNVRLVRIKRVRIFLDELPEGIGMDEPDGDIECGPHCATPAET